MQQDSNMQRKIRRTLRPSGKAHSKRRLDRLNVLFEAIEADKASDSDTALGMDSKTSQGAESSSPQATSQQPTQASWTDVLMQEGPLEGMHAHSACTFWHFDETCAVRTECKCSVMSHSNAIRGGLRAKAPLQTLYRSMAAVCGI